MKLTKNNWNGKDILEFQNYLKTFENVDKKEWSTNLLKTRLPVLCMKTKDLKDIINKISKGNYLQFLDLMIWQYYENIAINGFLISKIKDFDIRKKYLDIYSEYVDNWATCDLLTFNVDGNEEKYYNLVLEYIEGNNPFRRRIGVYILFDFIDKEDYTNKIFTIIDKFDEEDNYYVNMMIGWLLSECFIKQRDKTINYLEHNNLNKDAINKCIQKCRESRRISNYEKEMILQYKII